MQHDVPEHQQLAARIDELMQEVAAFSDPHARATTQELMQTLLAMYGAGLTRILEMTAEDEAAGERLIAIFAQDEVVSPLLTLHDLHPLTLEERILQALDEVRPQLKAHGGGVNLVSTRDGVAFLELQGSCQGCSASTQTLKQLIEQAIYRAAPDVERIETLEASEPRPVVFVPRRQPGGAKVSAR